MEPPPAAAAPPVSAAAAVGSAPHLNYPDSVDSSPRSRNADSWDEPQFPASGGKLRLMCSYNGHIVPRPHDKFLCYVGGDTRIVVADRHSTLSELTNRLSKTLLNGRSFTLKYQLPNEDLDSLISVTTDEDLENMIEEYDRLAAAAAANTTTIAAQKSSRLRLFLFPSKPDSGSSIGSLLENSTKSEDWFLNALNGAARVLGESSSVNCLLGLDDDVLTSGNGNSSGGKEGENQIESFGNVKGLRSSNSNKQGAAQDVHSVPDSPILETSSSFGSTSSSPSLANLPPIRVHVEDPKPSGIEEQFSQMSIAAAASAAVQKQDDGGFVVMSTRPPTVFPTIAPSAAVPGPGLIPTGDYSNRVISDDERSDQGIPVGYRKPPQPQPMPPQSQPKPTGGVDLASPDSVSSDNSGTNPLSRQRPPMIYQDPIIQNPSGNSRVAAINPTDPKLSDPTSKVQIQQFHDSSSYALPTQFEQQHQQYNPSPQQQQQQQQQHFMQAGTHYIHHPPPSGAVPMPSFYPMYAHQQQPLHPLDQQQYVYYVSARQAQAYGLPVQQQNYNESVAATAPSTRPQTPPTSSMMPPPAAAAYSTARNVPASKQPEMASGMYRTATAAAPHLVQVPSGHQQQQQQQQQQQFVGFSQIHHPSQSVNPTGNYAYEFADPAQAQVYYTQPLAPQLAAQYQTMTSAQYQTEASSQLPMDNIKQQVRTSQP